MKPSIAACLLLLSINLPAIAAVETVANQGFWNPVTITNSTSHNIAYQVVSSYNGPDNVYGLVKGKTDTYHSGRGDKNATLYVGICSYMDGNGKFCRKIEPGTLASCVTGNQHYNFNEVKSITIHSLKYCIVTCNDGNKCLAK
jgi:hypothetical protein